jgi:uncharacterized protein
MTLLDTGPLVALLDRSDAHHEWSADQMRKVHRPLLACEAVVSETCFLLARLPRARQQLRLWIQNGFVNHLPLNGMLAGGALALMERYANVPMSFADACLVALAEERPGAVIFTLDRDFLIYRRADGEVLELLAPFRG